MVTEQPTERMGGRVRRAGAQTALASIVLGDYAEAQAVALLVGAGIALRTAGALRGAAVEHEQR
jgi:hypothetical protein